MWFSDAGGVVCPSPCTFLVVTATRVEAIEGRAWDAGKNHLMNRNIAHNNELASANASARVEKPVCLRSLQKRAL